MLMPPWAPRSIEHPEDPGRPPYPSIWITPQMREFLKAFNGDSVGVDLCMFGWWSKKPTRVGGVLDNVQLLGVKCCHDRHEPLIGKDSKGNFKTSPSQVYTADFAAALGARHIATLLRCDRDGFIR